MSDLTPHDIGVLVFQHMQGHPPTEIIDVPVGTSSITLDCGHTVEIITAAPRVGIVHVGIHGDTLIVAEGDNG